MIAHRQSKNAKFCLIKHMPPTFQMRVESATSVMVSSWSQYLLTIRQCHARFRKICGPWCERRKLSCAHNFNTVVLHTRYPQHISAIASYTSIHMATWPNHQYQAASSISSSMKGRWLSQFSVSFLRVKASWTHSSHTSTSPQNYIPLASAMHWKLSKLTGLCATSLDGRCPQNTLLSCRFLEYVSTHFACSFYWSNNRINFLSSIVFTSFMSFSRLYFMSVFIVYILGFHLIASL